MKSLKKCEKGHKMIVRDSSEKPEGSSTWKLWSGQQCKVFVRSAADHRMFFGCGDPIVNIRFAMKKQNQMKSVSIIIEQQS